MSTPYEKCNDWCLGAIRYRNTIYMCSKKDFDIAKQENKSDEYETLKAYGHKFEQLCLSGKQSTDHTVTNRSLSTHLKINVYCYMVGKNIEYIELELLCPKI